MYLYIDWRIARALVVPVTAYLLFSLCFSGIAYAEEPTSTDYDLAVCKAYSDKGDRDECLRELGAIPRAVNAERKAVILEPQKSSTNEGGSGFSKLFLLFAALIAIYFITAPKKQVVAIDSANIKRRSGEESYKRKAYCSLKFSYEDSKGEVTNRLVHVTKGKRGDSFGGFCTMRNAERTFRFDRIIGNEVIDVKTGEVMEPAVWRAQFQNRSATKKAN